VPNVPISPRAPQAPIALPPELLVWSYPVLAPWESTALMLVQSAFLSLYPRAPQAPIALPPELLVWSYPVRLVLSLTTALLPEPHVLRWAVPPTPTAVLGRSAALRRVTTSVTVSTHIYIYNTPIFTKNTIIISVVV
jgi:hypothetical protein